MWSAVHLDPMMLEGARVNSACSVHVPLLDCGTLVLLFSAKRRSIALEAGQAAAVRFCGYRHTKVSCKSVLNVSQSGWWRSPESRYAFWLRVDLLLWLKRSQDWYEDVGAR